MDANSTFYAGITVIFVFFTTLSLSQRFLVAMGSLLGAGICYVHLKTSKKAICAVYFNPRLLVSIDDNNIKCIFPKANGCGRGISGPHIIEFKECRRRLPLKADRSKLHAHLRHMIELKLCLICLDLEGIDDCINDCVEKWSTDLGAEPFTSKIQASEDNERIDIHNKNNVANNGTDEPQIRRNDSKQDLPGAYPNISQPESSGCATPHNRTSSSEQGRVPNPESQSANIAPDALACSTPQSTLPDPLHPNVQQTTLQPATTSQRESLPSSRRPMLTRPATSTNDWCLVPYKVQKPETLFDRISKDLQEREIESGVIYVLRREDDEEYYKVGYSARDAQTRLEEHIEKCNVTWEIAWSTVMPTKHAKRVEKLIHIECGVRGIRYQENFCKNGGRSCAVQHREIIKAPLEEVVRCVKHWVVWISHDRYEEVPNPQSGLPKLRASKAPEPLETLWKLTDYHKDLKIHSVTDEFCLMSTGETWVQTPKQQKNNGRRKSTPVVMTPKRPMMLEDTRKTQSDQPETRNSLGFDTPDNPEASTSSRTLFVSTRTRRKSTLGRNRDARTHDSNAEDDAPNTEDVEMEAIGTLQIPRAPPSSYMDVDSSPGREQSTPTRPSKPVELPAVSVSGIRKCGICSNQSSGSNSLCAACLTPEPDEEIRNEDCNLCEDDEDPYVSCESQTAAAS